MKIKQYLWNIPALYVSFEFGSKLFEILTDKTEIVNIISVIKPLSSIAGQLVYVVGAFDFGIAIALLTFSYWSMTKKYHAYVFIWAMVWPFIPASFRYFGGVGDFEIVQVLSISMSALIAYILYKTYYLSSL